MQYTGRPHSLSSFIISALLLGWLSSGLVAYGQPASEDQAPTENPFPGRFPAPSLDGGTEWLNTSGPIELRDLRGKIVLLDFWTYCCINCMHVLPDLKYLEQKYADQLVVIGVHSAKFENEKESENIRQAIMRYEIEHPVINDSNMTIARKYAFNSWPTFILIDPEGNFVGRQPGEGNRELFDMVIGKMVEYHRRKGTLDETPVGFQLEREQVAPTPLRYPGKLLADAASQRLFIADSNHNRIVITNFDGELLDVIGTGAIGARDGAFAEATFDHPQGMTLVDETLYVADTENHLLRQIDLQAKQVSTLAGTGVQSRQRVSQGKLRELALNSPWDLAHKDGVLYIAMAGPHQMWKHDLGSDTLELYAGTGREDILDGPRAECALAQPSAVVVVGDKLYIVDSEGSAIRQIEMGKDGRVTTVVGPHDLPRGSSLFEFGDIDGIGDAVRLQHPIGLAYADGFLYVADTYNDRIKRVNIKTREAVAWLGTGDAGDALEPVQFSEPAGLSIADGNLFVADTNNHRVLKVDLKTKATTLLTINGLTPPDVSKSSADETFTGQATEVQAIKIRGDQPLQLKFEFNLPEDYKLNQLAPVIVKVTSPLLGEDVNGKRQRAAAEQKQATLSLPLTTAAANGELTVTVSYQFCREGGGLCRFGTQQWKVPVSLDAAGQSTVTLEATPELSR